LSSCMHMLPRHLRLHSHFHQRGNCVLTSALTSAKQAVCSTMPAPQSRPHVPMPALEGFLKHIESCNSGLEALPEFTPFRVGSKVLGQLKAEFVDQLARYPAVFQVEGRGPSGTVALHDSLSTPALRTAAVADVLSQLRGSYITGWRDELYPVSASFCRGEPDLLVERAAAVHFGIKAYGVHVNGYVIQSDGTWCLWVARRSLSKPNWPGKLDHIVAGGQPHGISLADNVAKECQEEAGIDAALAATARPVGAVSYTQITATGYKPDVLFVYDIQLPVDFQPVPQDGEVESFQLMSVEKVAAIVAGSDEFKANCNVVIIDFLIRHGFITPDAPGYLELVKGLRRGECS